jgi:hypothetical protein
MTACGLCIWNDFADDNDKMYRDHSSLIDYDRDDCLQADWERDRVYSTEQHTGSIWITQLSTGTQLKRVIVDATVHITPSRIGIQELAPCGNALLIEHWKNGDYVGTFKQSIFRCYPNMVEVASEPRNYVTGFVHEPGLAIRKNHENTTTVNLYHWQSGTTVMTLDNYNEFRDGGPLQLICVTKGRLSALEFTPQKEMDNPA